MNKGNFVKAVALKSGLTIKDVESAYKAMMDVVEETIKEDSIILPGFGTCKLVEKQARQGVNPATKQAISIPASNNPTFKFSSAFKAKFN